MAEAQEHQHRKGDPLRPLYNVDRGGAKFEATVNLTMHHGVRTAEQADRAVVLPGEALSGTASRTLTAQ